MNDIHPDWQETEGEAVPVRVKTTDVSEQKIAAQKISVSRKPAAIVGMFLVLGIGTMFFHGLDGLLTGQTTQQGSRKTVTITAAGFTPSIIEVEHGETIVWTNQDTAAHAVYSSSLCSNTGFCLQTVPLAKGGQGTFSITPDIPAGSYSYASSVDPKITGTIEIITTATQNFENIPSPSELNGSGIETNPNTAKQVNNTVGTIFDPAVNPFAIGGNDVPQNPYAKDGKSEDGFDANKNPVASIFEPASTQAQAILKNTKPARQPTTGAATWIVVLGSIGILGLAVRSTINGVTVLKD